MAEETGNVTIGVDIDITKAEQRLKDIKQRISELTEEFGSAGPEVLSNILKPLNEEYEQLSEQLKQVKETSESANESFKNQTKGLNDLKDVTDFAGDATKKLGLDETALGSAISGTTGFIGKSIVFLKNGAKAMDAMKTSTNNATGAVNKFKVALNGIAKHPILIALAAIAAGAAALYSRVKSLEDAKFDRYLGLIDRHAELLNEKLNNQITILNALGAKQSTVTRQQINNLKDLNNQLKLSKDRYADLWEAQGNDRITITAYAQQYLEGDMQYISKMSDEEQELVKRFAEAGEEIRKNNIELKTMENIILKINLAEEAHELTLRKINLEREKGITSLQKEANAQGRAAQRYSALAEVYGRLSKYSEAKFEYELKAYKNEQAQSATTIKMLNEEIHAIEEQKKANDKLIATYLSTGASAKAQQLDSENEMLDINIQRLNEQITAEKSIISLRKEMRNLNNPLFVLMGSDVDVKRAEILAKNWIDTFNYINSMAMMQQRGGDYPINDFFSGATSNLESFSGELSKLRTQVELDLGLIGKNYKSLSHLLIEESERLQKESDKNLKEAINNGKEIDVEENQRIVDRIRRVTEAYEDYQNLSSKILNNVREVTLTTMSTVQDRIEGMVNVFSDVTGGYYASMKKDLTSGIMDDYSKELADIANMYIRVHDAILMYDNASRISVPEKKKNETEKELEIRLRQEELQKKAFEELGIVVDNLNETEKTLYNSYKELGIPALTEMSNMINQLVDEEKELIITQKQIELNLASYTYDYMQNYQSLGGFNLREMEAAALNVIDKEKEYYDNLYAINGKYYDDLLQAGLSEAQAEEILAAKRFDVEKELIDKKKLINQQYAQTILNATSDTMNDIQGIMDVAFEDNKQVRGATLMMTTLADAAAAYTSVFAQAPGGVAAKTAQAVIASAAVMARGIASYNSLMNMTKDSGSESLSSATATNTIPTATGVDTTSVARTLIGSRYAGEGHTTQYVLVTDEVTARQKQAQGARRLETI